MSLHNFPEHAYDTACRRKEAHTSEIAALPSSQLAAAPTTLLSCSHWCAMLKPEDDPSNLTWEPHGYVQPHHRDALLQADLCRNPKTCGQGSLDYRYGQRGLTARGQDVASLVFGIPPS